MTKPIDNPVIFVAKVATITALLVFWGFSLFVLNHKDSFGIEKTELVATSKKALIVKVHGFKDNHEGQDVTIGEYHEDKDGVWRVNVTRHEHSFFGLSNGLFELSCIAVLAIPISLIILL